MVQKMSKQVCSYILNAVFLIAFAFVAFVAEEYPSMYAEVCGDVGGVENGSP